ncbi:hypothetical protein LB519_11830 [Mesorhizobium sp. AD1-1]|uniref:hypothetical protein n=1 Tax=Mesorhizobium sp. AD1-1 TaxID=2876621 RepID=UPI001CCAD76C|nr:hypothetical protein [Mesorhizobium sp. AD1-1]MBZ9718541.1 hypothetical protein [Mesorhizobium sp. AD1-1]
MDRSKLTFEEAEGASAVPSQLALKEVSQELRAILWARFYDVIRVYDGEIVEPWDVILRNMHIYKEHKMADDFDPSWRFQSARLKKLFSEGTYIEIFGFIQYVLRQNKCPYGLDDIIDSILSYTRAAYRVVDGATIAPVASEEDRVNLERAFADLAKVEFNGARQHLRKAAESAAAGQWADSVRESVHSVEATARKLIPEARELGPALTKLEESAAIHGALKKGFGAIYGFSSDEKGIRHPLIDDRSANVDETDALFMLGACAAFVSYLIGKGRAAGLIAA